MSSTWPGAECHSILLADSPALSSRQHRTCLQACRQRVSRCLAADTDSSGNCFLMCNRATQSDRRSMCFCFLALSQTHLSLLARSPTFSSGSIFSLYESDRNYIGSSKWCRSFKTSPQVGVCAYVCLCVCGRWLLEIKLRKIHFSDIWLLRGEKWWFSISRHCVFGRSPVA